MKLQTIFAISMALTMSSAITAQSDAVDHERRGASLSFGMDDSGVDFAVSGGYANGTTVLLVSLGQAEDDRLQLPAALGGGEIELEQPMFILAVGQGDADGNYHLGLNLNTQALADAGLTVYVQAVSINSSDWPDVPAEPNENGATPLLLSKSVAVDFRQGMRDWNDQTQRSSGGGAESPDGDDGTDGDSDCRCPAVDSDASGRTDHTIE